MCSPDGILEKDIHIIRLTEVLSDSPVSLAAGCKKNVFEKRYDVFRSFSESE